MRFEISKNYKVAWEPDRHVLFDGLDEELDSTAIVKYILESGRKWKLVQIFVNDIMSKKEDMERLQEREVQLNRLTGTQREGREDKVYQFVTKFANVAAVFLQTTAVEWRCDSEAH